ncbi:MAG TPA: glycine cleavage system aminomethyltransferase GcvT [Allocoleopsis sp.]
MTQSEIAHTNLSRTPLYDLALLQKAKFTAFSGWDMPVQYSGIILEHQSVRNDCGMFDISHMGKFSLQGQDLLTQLQLLVPSDLHRLQPGQGQYTVLLNTRGGIIDDIIFYYQGQDDQDIQKGIMIVNAGTCAKDKEWLLNQLDLSKIQFQDLSLEKVLIAVQGPNTVNYLQSLVSANLEDLKYFSHTETNILGNPGFIARTGYTGEDGFELMLDIETGQKLWQNLINLGVQPCGLGARDTLRLEAAMSLYGQDIDETTTPLEANLGWLVHLDSQGDFIGRTVLEKQKNTGVVHKLVGLEMQSRNIARHGYKIFAEGEIVGEVTSGTMSPTLGKAIALAYISTNFAEIGQVLNVEIRGKTYPAKVVKKPFYRRKKK